MHWTAPPDNYADLMLWRVFVASCEADVWQVVERWIKKYGNPYVVPTDESEEDFGRRQVYQNALRYTYHNK